MACVLVFLNFLAVIAAIGAKPLKNIFPIGKIIGGRGVQIQDAPWHVSLEDSGYLFCSGSIISENYVLTAAHCTDETPAEFVQVRSGSGVLETGGVITSVVEIIQNANYSGETFDYDVAILRLAKGLSFNAYQQAVTLHSREIPAGDIGRVVGWGMTKKEDRELVITLQGVDIGFINREDCYKSYMGAITDRMICAGEIGEETCQGDSGGAITVNGSQVGIVSWGYGCAFGDYSGVYANVMAFMDFINEKTENKVLWD